MESKRGALIVLGLLLVLSVVVLVVGATRDEQGGSDFKATLASWQEGLLARFAKSQALAPTELRPNPFNAAGECTLPGAGLLQCEVAKSDRAVRSATLELAGPGIVDVTLVARREGEDLECHKKLERSTTSGKADKKATVALTAFEPGGTLTIRNLGAPGSSVLLLWRTE